MKLNRHGRIASVLLAVLLLITLTSPVWGQTPITRIRNAAIQVLSVTNTATIADLTVSGNSTLDTLNLAPASTIAVTMNATVTPLGALQPLSSAGTVNTASITVGDAGDVLVLYNTTATSIVFTDTGTLKLTGNITLGQYDTLELVSDGTNWLQRATANN